MRYIERMTLQELITRVRTTLNTGGEVECRAVRTRTTHRLRYQSGAPGFRVGFTPDPPDGFSEDTAPGRVRVYVKVHGSKKSDLRRYASILRAAGMETHIDGSCVYPTAERVWVMEQVDLLQPQEDVRDAADS